MHSGDVPTHPGGEGDINVLELSTNSRDTASVEKRNREEGVVIFILFYLKL